MIVAAYGEGALYPPHLAKNTQTIIDAGWTHLFFGMFHVKQTGDLYYNDVLAFEDGGYVGDPDWPFQMNTLFDGVEAVIPSVGGGGGVQDFFNIDQIYQKGTSSPAWLNLTSNFSSLLAIFPSVGTIDLDNEDFIRQESFVAFCLMLSGLGCSLSFCPPSNSDMDFWVDSLQALMRQTSVTVNIPFWNLQCYEHLGLPRTPQQWAEQINAVVKDFDTTTFFNVGFNAASDSSASVQTRLAAYYGATPPAVGGGFIWSIGEMLDGKTGANEMPSYVAAINAALDDSAGKPSAT